MSIDIPAGPRSIGGAGVFNATEKVAATSWAAGLAEAKAQVKVYELVYPIAPGQEEVRGYLVQWVQHLKGN